MAKTPRATSSKPLPAGTVTFLFTDIEGSTRLWDAHHDAMRAALARHDEVLRQSIEGHSGFIFKTAGDAFCAAFATAPDALAAALSAQRALWVEPWPEPVRLQVRMALDTGASELRDNDYFGAPLNHAARLLAVGHGGQTLLSEIMQGLCRDRLPMGAALKVLGEYRLKDLPRVETIFQLCHPDLPSAFPPLKTLFAAVDEDVPSIAVLPFVNMSRDEENEYFADGLAEELLNVLSKIRGLRVASRTSAFSFKGSKIDIATVAQKLNVATVLEGSVRGVGKRVRISAQLIDAATDSHLWAGSYDRELEDIFEVQDDITQSVVKELRSALLEEKQDASADIALKTEVLAAAKGRGENAEAYRRYLQGRFFEDRQTREDTEKSIGYYQQALAIDPNYALAWTGMSRAYADQAGFGWGLGIIAGVAKAREAAQRALELQPSLAEANVALGWVCLYYDWDWQGADRYFRRALELSPNNVQAVCAAGILATDLGRFEEGLALLRCAAVLDPLSVWVQRSLSRLCRYAGLMEEAEMAAKTVYELNPQGRLGRLLGFVRLDQDRLDEALEAFRNEALDGFRLLGVACVAHAQGRTAEADAAMQELTEKDAARAAYQVAEGYAYLGKMDLAFEWLERAYTQRDPGTKEAKVDPLLRNLHADPRWRPFLEKMGLVGNGS